MSRQINKAECKRVTDIINSIPQDIWKSKERSKVEPFAKIDDIEVSFKSGIGNEYWIFIYNYSNRRHLNFTLKKPLISFFTKHETELWNKLKKIEEKVTENLYLEKQMEKDSLFQNLEDKLGITSPKEQK